jgi:integrase
MASIDKRPNGKWRARYRERPGGPQRSRHFDRKTDAERFLARIQSQLLDGSYVDPTAGARLFADYAASWQQSQVHRPTTVAQVTNHLRNHILPTFGERPIASIRTSEVQAWVRSRTEVLAPATVELVFRIFSAILSAAVDDRLIARNPCTGVRLPRQAKRQVQPPTVEQVTALIDAIPERYRALVVLAAGTGLRQGECFGLTVDRVDFLRRTVRVDRQLVLADCGPPQFGPPKTQASVRTVPLPDVVASALAASLERSPARTDGLIFTDTNGNPLRRNRFGEVWRRTVERIDATGLRFHDLRHFYASLLIRHGESVKVVQARLGHASASETLDTYSHLWPDNEERTRTAVDECFQREGSESRAE